MSTSAAFDSTTNLVLSQESHVTPFPSNGAQPAPQLSADGRLNIVFGNSGDSGLSAFNRSLVNIAQFATDFTVQTASNGTGDNGAFNFVLDGDSPRNFGPNNGYANHGSGNGLLGPSIAIDFATGSVDTGTTNSIQIGIDGRISGNAFSLDASGINLAIAGTYAIHIEYANSILSATITDLSSMKSATAKFSMNVPGILGSCAGLRRVNRRHPLNGRSGRIDVLAWSYASSGSYTLPPPNLTSLSDVNIGSAGSASYSNGVYSLSSTGAIGYGVTDSFNYDSTNWTGDGTLTAEVTSETMLNLNGQPGIMFRDSSANNAIMVALVATPAGGVRWVYRSATGANATTVFQLRPANRRP